jgi:hypothetical protein
MTTDVTTAAAMPQHLHALARANTIRLARAAAKRQLDAGELAFAEFLDRPEVATMPVIDALRAMRRWGRTRARRALNVVGIANERRAVEDLTSRQRVALLGYVAGRPGARA